MQSDKLADALEDIHHELMALVGGRPPTQAELDDARRALIEGQTRQFETPAALVNRYANLFIHGLPPDHYSVSRPADPDIDLDALIACTGRSTRTPWSPWSSPTRPKWLTPQASGMGRAGDRGGSELKGRRSQEHATKCYVFSVFVIELGVSLTVVKYYAN